MHPARVLPVAFLALLLAGCGAPADCDTFDRFQGDAPGFFDALHALPDGVADVGPEPGYDLPALDEALPHSTLHTLRYDDPDGPLRHATVHFGDPGVPARLVVAVPPDDDRPGPLFDALWDALAFEDDRDAVRAELLATRADAGHLLSYQADVRPRAAVAEHLESLGGPGAANETTPQSGLVRLSWTDWTYEVSVMVREWRPTDGGAVARVDAMPHGPIALLVPTTVGWSPADAEAWLQAQGAEHGFPVDGVVLRRAPIESLCL